MFAKVMYWIEWVFLIVCVPITAAWFYGIVEALFSGTACLKSSCADIDKNQGLYWFIIVFESLANPFFGYMGLRSRRRIHEAKFKA